MKSRLPDSCVLLASRTRVARADFLRGELVHLAADHDSTPEGFVGLVELATTLGGELPKRVWILAEDVFALEIRVRAQAVDGLKREQTERLLGYEASAISGLAANEALIAAIPCPAAPLERGFMVVQVSRADRDAVEGALASRGARLAGIAHPAGVPRALAANEERDWRRLEAWPDLAVEVEGANGRVTARLRRTDPTRRTRDLVGDKPVTETLATGGGPTLAVHGVSRAFDLAIEADLSAWMQAWGRALHDDASRIAAIGAAERALSPRLRAAYAVAGCAVAALACGLHYASRVEARERAVEDLRVAREPAQRVAKLRSESAALKSEVERLEAEAATMRAALARAGWSAEAPSRLLDAAAIGRPAGLTIDDLEIGWRGARVRGVALHANLVDELGSALSAALAPEGFVVAPADRKRRELESGQELFEYTLEIVPRGAPPAPEAAR